MMGEQLWRGPPKEGETAEGSISWDRGDGWFESFGAVRLPFDEMVERAYRWSQAHGLPVLCKERVWIEGGLQRWLRCLLAAALGGDDG